MTKSTTYLDLDSISPPSKTVRLFGVEYPMHQMSLHDFVTATREQAEFEKKMAAGEVGDIEQIEYMLNSVKRILPTISPEHVARLTMDQLVAITAFAQATAEAGAPESQSAEGEPGKEQSAES